ncbi:ATP-dependent DNA ligase [Caulobacter ginsengisoli]|uniref:DNA ligase (ATP) n=1 Tax=Caulobacter ginsengisoli TaxID=400775 RepID=A0ABU0ITR6_9CAUL|nr:ATP-dependent DNA ligase [Caulobacter ginsengisoli]MDQ0464357.1 ATP-dependent DNA ligase [Caulobacter ginsengisoli]
MAKPLTPMEARTASELPSGEGWWYEPKWDGFRCLADRRAGAVSLTAKSGKSLGRYFPEVALALGALPGRDFLLDGELLIQQGGFEALQARLHPAASRIARLSRETPARLMAFDMPGEAPLAERRAALERFVKKAASEDLVLTPGTTDRRQAQAWLTGGRYEGVVAKRLDEPYRPGERTMIKVKRIRTADCVVGGFRYDKAGRLVASLLLGLYDEAGRLDHVGFTSGLKAADKPELTARLEALCGGPGFTGDAPGGPSRWATEASAKWEPLRPELVVEVSFDHVSGGRFRHGTRLIRFRPDKAPEQCRKDQLA